MPSTTPQLRPPVRASCRFDPTFSASLRLREAIADVSDDHCLVIDCLTLWTANALEAFGADQVEAHATAAARVAAVRTRLIVAVTNEVGLGIVPDNALARGYRDLLGRVNAIWAEAADQVYLLVAGRAVALAKTDSLSERLQ